MVVPENSVAQKGAILARRTAAQRSNLLDDELRVFNAAKLVHIELESKLHDTPVGRSRLVERDGIDDIATVRRAHAQFEMVFADRALFDYGEFAAPHGLWKSRSPWTGIS